MNAHAHMLSYITPYIALDHAAEAADNALPGFTAWLEKRATEPACIDLMRHAMRMAAGVPGAYDDLYTASLEVKRQWVRT